MRKTIKEITRELLDRAVANAETVYYRDIKRGDLDEAITVLSQLRALEAVKKQIRIVIENEAKEAKDGKSKRTGN